MSEMVERVARAIHDSVNRNPAMAWEECHPNYRSAKIGEARAALQAMKEPTEGMASVVAPMMAWKALGGGQLDPLAHASEVYRAMIKAALT